MVFQLKEREAISSLQILGFVTALIYFGYEHKHVAFILLTVALQASISQSN